MDYKKSRATGKSIKEREWGRGNFYNDWSIPNRGGAQKRITNLNLLN